MGFRDSTFKVTLVDSNKVIQTKYLDDTVSCIELSTNNSVVVTGALFIHPPFFFIFEKCRL